MNGDFQLGNNFLKRCYPIEINRASIKFIKNGSKLFIPFSKYHSLRCNNFSPIAKRDEINVLKTNNWIFPLLEQNFNEDSLKIMVL